MSLFCCNYKCLHCGYTIENFFSGGRMLSDYIYEELQCTQCNKAYSVKLTPEQDRARDFPLSECCQAKMELWNKTCPKCGNKMNEKILYDEF